MEIIIRDVEWKLRFENKWQPPRGRRLSTNSPAPCPVAGVKRRAISWYQSRTNHRRFLPFPTRREKGRGRGQFVIVSKFISQSLISPRFAPPPSFTESPALGLMTSEHSDVTTPSRWTATIICISRCCHCISQYSRIFKSSQTKNKLSPNRMKLIKIYTHKFKKKKKQSWELLLLLLDKETERGGRKRRRSRRRRWPQGI